MQFICSGYRQQYNLNPTIGELQGNNSGVVNRQAHGLRISSNATRILDTDAQARQDGWTPEQKIKMERHLLSHADFGRNRNVDSGRQEGDDLLNVQVWELMLAPGQVIIPEEHVEFCKAQQWYERWASAGELDTILGPSVQDVPEDTRICVFSRPWQGSAMRCQEPALEGEDYCANHLKEPAEVGAS